MPFLTIQTIGNYSQELIYESNLENLPDSNGSIKVFSCQNLIFISSHLANIKDAGTRVT